MRYLCLPLLFAGLIAAQSPDQKPEDSFTRPPKGQPRLIQEIRHELLMLPYYSIFDDLSFRINGSTVTLLGEVTRPTLKSSAENVVKDIEGITQVVNRIEVLPLSPMDDSIRRNMVGAIYGSSQIGTRYGNQALPSIHIIVKNGHVTLEGVVANEFDKNFINVRARAVPNVFSVDNQLRIEKDSK